MTNKSMQKQNSNDGAVLQVRPDSTQHLLPGYVALGEVSGMPGNPKEHDLGGINVSYRQFGFIDRLIINKTTGHLVAGHGRIDGLRQDKAGGRAAPVGVMVQDGEWLVPCDYIEIAEQQEMAAAIALNRTEEMGGWDEAALVRALSELALQGEELLAVTGFDGDDLDRMMAQFSDTDTPPGAGGSGGSDGSEELGRADELQDKWQVEEGQVWRIGPTFIICGDCRDDGVWRALLSTTGVSMADGVFCSPPYAEQRKGQYGGVGEDEYVGWWEQVQANVRRHLAGNGNFFVNIKPHSSGGERSLYVMDLVTAMVRQWDWRYIDEFCWQRLMPPGSWPNRFKNGFEPIHQFAVDANIAFYPDQVGGEAGVAKAGRNTSMGSYYNAAGKTIEWDAALPSNFLGLLGGNARGDNFPAAFPLPLPEFFVKAFSAERAVWVDPFSGSGTTMLAAANNNRIGLGIELLPKFVAVTLERLGNSLGQTPILI